METIRTYLENMFMSYPNTSEVQRAKMELLQMMEDKYLELKSEGRTENEVIGIVISEFGNIDELADDLGIKNIVAEEKNDAVRKITLEEVKRFIKSRGRLSFMLALGIAFCIMSVAAPIFADAYAGYYKLKNQDIAEGLGVTVMFLFIAAGVGLIVFAGVLMDKWSYIKKECCQIDFGTTDYIKKAREDARVSHVLYMIIGIMLCIISVVPVILLDALGWEEASPVFMFLFIATGVLMIVYAAVKWQGYSILLHISKESASGYDYIPENKSEVTYDNKTVAKIMSVYWPTVTCIYLSWSFLTWAWYMTWIVWVIAGIICMMVKAIFGKQS